MDEENADRMHIWDDLNLAAAILELSLRSVWERKTVTGVHIWNGPNLESTLFHLV